ncbi:MAG: IS3 family transposase [Myxococcota bacterium]
MSQLLETEKANYSMRMMCRALGVARSSVYERRSRLPSKREQQDRSLTTRIKVVHRASEGVYGSPRVHEELRQGQGIRVARKRVDRLMREMGLEVVTRRDFE